MAFTTVTSLAFARIVSDAKISDGRALTVSEAWTLYIRWREQPCVTFLHEPATCQLALASMVLAGVVTAAGWTDAYLAAFAIEAGARLVSFDHGFTKYPGLNFLHLRT